MEISMRVTGSVITCLLAASVLSGCNEAKVAAANDSPTQTAQTKASGTKLDLNGLEVVHHNIVYSCDDEVGITEIPTGDGSDPIQVSTYSLNFYLTPDDLESTKAFFLKQLPSTPMKVLTGDASKGESPITYSWTLSDNKSLRVWQRKKDEENCGHDTYTSIFDTLKMPENTPITVILLEKTQH